MGWAEEGKGVASQQSQPCPWLPGTLLFSVRALGGRGAWGGTGLGAGTPWIQLCPCLCPTMACHEQFPRPHPPPSLNRVTSRTGNGLGDREGPYSILQMEGPGPHAVPRPTSFLAALALSGWPLSPFPGPSRTNYLRARRLIRQRAKALVPCQTLAREDKIAKHLICSRNFLKTHLSEL